jgi:hypothetical protein
MSKGHYFLKLLWLPLVCLYPRPYGHPVGRDFPLPDRAAEQHGGMREQVKRIYDSQVGVREHGANSGAQVEGYLRYVSLKKGSPWCAAFVCWAYGQAKVANPRTGWSPDLFKKEHVVWERQVQYGQKSKVQTDTPKRADIFGIYFPEKGRIAHTGFIDSWGNKWLVTVEGNTNGAGSREGDGVYRKRRLVKSIYSVSRYID